MSAVRVDAADFRPVYTLDSAPAVVGSHEEAIERARALKPSLRGRIAEGQELRRLPSESVAEVLEAGLYTLAKPKRYGGSELGGETVVAVAIELAKADPSAGWVHMLWATHFWMQAQMSIEAQDEMWANPNGLASSCVSTTGELVAVEGGYRWTGRGFFSTGSDHCDWLAAMLTLPDVGDSDDPLAAMSWCAIPREDFEIIDDWHVMGLQGTGSKTVVFDDVFIPKHRVLRMASVMTGNGPGREVNKHPMYGANFYPHFLTPMAAPAIGAASGLLELFFEKIGAKLEGAGAAINDPYAASGAMGATFARLAHVAAQLDACQALLANAPQRYGLVPATEVGFLEAATMKRNIAWVAQQARRAANTLYEEGGGSGLKESSLLQQFWRDSAAAAAHHGLTWDWQSDQWPKAVLGLDGAGVGGVRGGGS